MSKKNSLKMKKCERCKKKTEQTNTSEGFGGTVYYQDWTCSVCGKINMFKSRKPYPTITEYTVSTGCCNDSTPVHLHLYHQQNAERKAFLIKE